MQKLMIVATMAVGLVATLKAQTAKAVHSDVVVFTGDNVIPQFVDGGSWQTTLKFVNLENHAVHFTVNFITDDGNPMMIPMVGIGPAEAVAVDLVPQGSITLQSEGTAPGLSQGWADIVRQNTNDSIAGFAIFRQRVPGIPDQEAVVPMVNQFENHFVMMYDNTGGFVTAIALANPTPNAVSIPVVIRSENGQVLQQTMFSMCPYCHSAFTISSAWQSTIGTRGAIEFITSGFGVGALGLRFNGAAFTSFDVFENFAWTQQ